MRSSHLPLLALGVLCVSGKPAAENSGSLRSCTEAETTEAMTKCMGHINNLKSMVEKHKGKDTLAAAIPSIKTVCVETTSCLSSWQCKEVETSQKVFGETCQELYAQGADVEKCFPKFFDAVHKEKNKCSKNYKFINPNLAEKREAYTAGKACVLEIVKKECAKPALDYMTMHYNDLVDLITTKNENCSGLSAAVSYLQCKPLEDEATKFALDKSTKIKERNQKCRNYQACIKDSCVIDNEARKNLEKSCRITEVFTDARF